MDQQKVKKELGFSVSVNLRDGLALTVAWTQKNQDHIARCIRRMITLSSNWIIVDHTRSRKNMVHKVLTVVGARPQFIKAAAVSRAFRGRSGLNENGSYRSTF